MKKRALLFFVAACSAAPLTGTAQNPAPPPPVAPPAPPAPPATERSPRASDKERSSVFLGVEISPVPAALSDQLNLHEGFGLLVESVVPGSAAEIAGVKAHDVLKALNDQMLTSGEQLTTLVRSFSEGQEVALMVLHKGQETKLTAKLQKRLARSSDQPAERAFELLREERTPGSDTGFTLELSDLSKPGLEGRIREFVAHQSRGIDLGAPLTNEHVKRRVLEALREHASGSLLDLGGVHVLLSDSTGRVQISSSHGKRTLTVHDADGKKVFDGPMNTPEQRKAIPADVLPKVEALEREQAIAFPKGDDSSDEDNGKHTR